MNQIFPFTAIVGQEKMTKALVLNAINPKIGGVLLRGDKGTGKSTAVRALAEVLPEVEVSDCRFGCSPDAMCRDCKEKLRRGELKFRRRKMRVVELPLSATEDRVVGTIDVEAAIRDGKISFQPGVLAEANNNILYIDEVNLLEDHIVDTLLDAAASGWNVVEREGISVRHPAKFVLIGTMNPEEGELRPQLLDRFGMVVDVKAITDPELRAEVIRRAEEFSDNPERFRKKFEDEQERLRKRIDMARKLLKEVVTDKDILKAIARLCSELGIETHRADITTLRAAKAIAAFKGKRNVTTDDVVEAAELTLPHRMKSHPFERPKVDFDTIESILKTAVEDHGSDGENRTEDDNDNWNKGGGSRKFDAKDAKLPEVYVKSKLPARKGKRVETPSTNGRYVKPSMKGDKIAIDATIRIALAKGRLRPSVYDLRYKICSGRSASSIALLVDASGSMASLRRMELAKGVLLRLLQDAYIKRDRISMIVFRGNDAEVVVPPTTSPQLAASRVSEIPTGGKTPLPAGMYKAYELLKAEKRKGYQPILVVISDGRGNVSMGGGDVKEEVIRISKSISREGITTVMVDADDHVSLGFAKEIVTLTNALHYRLKDLDQERLFDVVNALRTG